MHIWWCDEPDLFGLQRLSLEAKTYLVFGIIEEVSSKMKIYQMNLLAIKIGADCVISLVHDYLEKRADNSTTLVLTFVGDLALC